MSEGATHVPPPYLIRTERLTIRCWEPRDAPLLGEAIETSLDHLRPWMPWAHEEPKPLVERIELLRTFRGRFDLGEDFVYGVFEGDEREVVGGSGLHTRVGAGALEIGYWIRASHVGRGYARETTAALTMVALRVCGVDRVEIHVDPANVASLRIPRALGFIEEGTLRRRLPSVDGPQRDSVVFTLLADELEGSAVASVAVDAYDAAGRAVPL
jgi:RimJ/RimL family protein N-acetyltransferase